MASNVLRKELVLINFKTDEYRFYNIEVNKISYSELQVVYHHGKLGTKGTKHIKESTSYKEAMSLAYKKIYEKKAENYHEKEDIMGWLGQLDTNKDVHSKVSNHTKHHKESLANPNKYRCDICKKHIKKEVYEEINKWGRSSGGWDKDENSISYKKVLCIDCQWKYDIFKKRL